MPLWFLPGDSLMGQRQQAELPRTSRGRRCRRIDTTINYDAFTFGGVEKEMNQRMAMQTNCDGSLTDFESQKNNEISRHDAGRGFEI